FRHRQILRDLDPRVSSYRQRKADPHLASGRLARVAFPGRCLAGWQAGDCMMKAVSINGYNATPSVEEVPSPSPGAGEVVVRVKAAGLNPLDVKLHRGYMEQSFPLQFPYTLGTDFSGRIEAIGTGVQGWKIGDVIIGRTDPTAGGAIAEYVVVSADYLSKAPSSVSLEEAAGIPTAAGTAWQALFGNANLARGQTVLIHAGAGGIGS